MFGLLNTAINLLGDALSFLDTNYNCQFVRLVFSKDKQDASRIVFPISVFEERPLSIYLMYTYKEDGKIVTRKVFLPPLIIGFPKASKIYLARELVKSLT